MIGDRSSRLRALRPSPAEVADRSERIRRAVLARTGRFDSLAEADLRLLFGLYDAECFGGLLSAMLREDGAGEVRLRPSARLTSAAGKTIRRRARTRSGLRVVVRDSYEIAVSTYLLFPPFGEADRPLTVAGLACRDRLEALQRIFEHELIHLAEFLAEGRTSCSAAPFRRLARAIFGHSATVHELLTPREFAEVARAIRVGDRVVFEHGGLDVSGRVNRITKRATVLVEDPAGRLFSDGRRYATFYVPLDRLRKRGEPPGA